MIIKYDNLLDCIQVSDSIKSKLNYHLVFITINVNHSFVQMLVCDIAFSHCPIKLEH
jgi:hypothetical protein